MINIHAREITDELASLVKEIDKLVAHPKDNSSQNRSFFVLLTDDPDAAAEKLTQVAKECEIKNTPLTVFDGISGPKNYNIHKDAEITVMMWKGAKVVKNSAFGKGELNEDAVKKVLADAKEFLN